MNPNETRSVAHRDPVGGEVQAVQPFQPARDLGLARAWCGSGYVTQPVAVDGGAGEVPTNSGIVVVYDIQHALQAIDVFMAVSSPDTGEVKECDGGP